jgi:hypothetical protein
MAALAVAVRRDSPAAFADWENKPAFADGMRDPVYGAFGRAYFPAIHGEACRDFSFAVTAGGAPVLLALCNLLDGTLGYFGLPLKLIPAAGASDAGQAEAVAAAVGHIDALARTQGAREIVVADIVSDRTLSPVGAACSARRARRLVKQHGLCDLAGDEAAIKRSLRKSFHSLVNWGRRNMRMAYVGKENPDRGLFDSAREFHARVAGRVTRPAASWDVMYRWLSAGGGELSLGYLDGGGLVAATMTVDGTDTSYYASGVYDRERFDRPLAHWPVFDAIQRSRARGMRFYDLGELPAKGEASDKEVNIGYFKKGFATGVETRVSWSWSPQDD